MRDPHDPVGFNAAAVQSRELLRLIVARFLKEVGQQGIAVVRVLQSLNQRRQITGEVGRVAVVMPGKITQSKSQVRQRSRREGCEVRMPCRPVHQGLAHQIVDILSCNVLILRIFRINMGRGIEFVAWAVLHLPVVLSVVPDRVATTGFL